MTARCRHDRGSALLLYPAAVFVVLVLGAIAVDLSARHLAVRQLEDVAASAANDAVTYGLDESTLRATGEYVLDPGRVEQAVARSVAAHRPTARVRPPVVQVDGVVVTVTLDADVDPVFAAALPGGGSRPVHATASAEAIRR